MNPPNRTYEDWRTLTTYFMNLVHHESELVPSAVLDAWASVIHYWSCQKTVEGVHYSVNTFHHLAFYLNNADSLSEFRQDTAKSLLHTVLNNWKFVLSTTRNGSTTNLPATQSRSKKQQEQPQVPSLSQMLEYVKEWRRLRMPITTLTYNNLLIHAAEYSAKTMRDKREVPIYCEEVLEHMLSEYSNFQQQYHHDIVDGDEGGVIARPDDHTYTLLLRAWAKSHRHDSVQRSLRLLERMNQLSQQGIIRCRPNKRMYNSLLEIFCERRTVEDMRTAEQIFQDMDQGQINEDVYPDFVSYRIVFFGLCHILDKDDSDAACKRAISFLYEMEIAEKQHRVLRTPNEHPGRPRLDSSMYANLIMTFVRLRKIDFAEQVHEMHRTIMSESGEDRFSPDYHTKRAMLFLNVAKDNIEEAENLLVEMEQDFEQNPRVNEGPRIAHYEAVIECLLRSENNKAGPRAAAWIVHLVNLAQAGVQIDLALQPLLVNEVFHRLSTRQAEDSPDRASIAIEAPYDTERFLRILRAAERSLGLRDPLVNHDSYSRAIQAWARRSTDYVAPRRAEKLLLEMQRRSETGETFLSPRTCHYTGVINAWSRSGQKGSLRHAKEIFQEAYEQYKAGKKEATPDIVFYGSMISSCARAGDLDGMEYYCKLMIEDHEQGNESAHPTTPVLNSMLVGFLKGSDELASTSKRVFRLVKRLRAYVHFDERTKYLLREIEEA